MLKMTGCECSISDGNQLEDSRDLRVNSKPLLTVVPVSWEHKARKQAAPICADALNDGNKLEIAAANLVLGALVPGKEVFSV